MLAVICWHAVKILPWSRDTLTMQTESVQGGDKSCLPTAASILNISELLFKQTHYCVGANQNKGVQLQS